MKDALNEYYHDNGFLVIRGTMPFLEQHIITSSHRTISTFLAIPQVPSGHFSLNRARETKLLLKNCQIKDVYPQDAAVDESGESAEEPVNLEELIRDRKEESRTTNKKLPYCEAVIQMYKPNNISGIIVPEEDFKPEKMFKHIASRHSFMTAFDIDIPYVIMKDFTQIIDVLNDESLFPELTGAKYLGKIEGFLSSLKIDYIESLAITADDKIQTRFRISEAETYARKPLHNLTLSYEEIDSLLRQKSDINLIKLEEICQNPQIITPTASSITDLPSSTITSPKKAPVTSETTAPNLNNFYKSRG